jgi:hypothetical protein
LYDNNHCFKEFCQFLQLTSSFVDVSGNISLDNNNNSNYDRLELADNRDAYAIGDLHL